MKLRGMDELMSQIERIGNIAEEKLVPLLKEAAEETILPEAKRLVPVDTGELRDSLEIRETPNGIELYAGTDHALPVEFGTVHQEAQPYMRPAIDTQSDAMLKKVADRLEIEIEKVI